MLLRTKVAWCLFLFGWASCFGIEAGAQYFNKLHDYNQSSDLGANVCIRSDGSYLVTGQALYNPYAKYSLISMVISSDGQLVLNRHTIGSSFYNYYIGFAGAVHQCGTGYISPYGFATSKGVAGIVKLDSTDDTVFTRTYTDTTRYSDGPSYVAVLQDSTFLVAGERDTAAVGIKLSYGYVQHIDNSGQLLWMKTYQKDSTGEDGFTSIQGLPNHNILVGGYVIKAVKIGLYDFHFSQPWFMLLDSCGNLLKDTLYNTHYLGGGNIFADKNGGYFHWGGKDSLPMPYPSSVQYIGNFPFYLAHLDTNFQMNWRVSFPPYFPNTVSGNGFGNIFQVIQTKDSGYLVMGSRNGGFVNGWLVKLDKKGIIKWEHSYYQDSTQDGYLVDAEERATGGYIVVGWTRVCNTCNQDIWLLSIDSNGCEIPGCSYTPAAVIAPLLKEQFSLYPNPTTGAFTIVAPSDGTLKLFNLQGAKVAEYPIVKGRRELLILSTLAAGIYVGQYLSSDGKTMKTTRIIYQP